MQKKHKYNMILSLDRTLKRLNDTCDLINPQYNATLMDEDKNALVSHILAHLCTHEEVPADLCLEIKQHFMESDETPPPPFLEVLNLDDVIMSMNYERMC